MALGEVALDLGARQPRHALGGRRQEIAVSRHGFIARIGPVRQQGEVDGAGGIGQVVDFQPFDQFGPIYTY